MDKRRLLFIVICSFAGAYTLRVASRQLRLSAGIDAKVTAPVATVSAVSRSLRPNYPYSVIAGGVYSPAELRSAIERDRLVHAHYSGFDLASARLVTLKDDRFQYVSYRMKDRIYWTRKKLRIPKGEVLLTDGSNFARTRCGNRLSAQARPETRAEEPSERALSLPPFTPALWANGDVKLAPPPPSGDLAQEAPVLPFELPRLAPYIPAAGAVAGLPAGQPALFSYPPTVGTVFSGPPAGPGFLPVATGTPSGTTPGSSSPPVVVPVLPSTPILPIVPVTPGALPPMSPVPEPATLSLLAASLCGLLWLLSRVLRKENSDL